MLHLPTLISLCFILNLFIAVFFFSVYSYKKQPSFLFFATACCSFITAIALIGLRGVIDYPLLTYFFCLPIYYFNPTPAYFRVNTTKYGACSKANAFILCLCYMLHIATCCVSH